jgi:hypothetical protein
MFPCFLQNIIIGVLDLSGYTPRVVPTLCPRCGYEFDDDDEEHLEPQPWCTYPVRFACLCGYSKTISSGESGDYGGPARREYMRRLLFAGEPELWLEGLRDEPAGRGSNMWTPKPDFRGYQ